MADELIDIVDKNGNPTGVQHMKSYAHKKGLRHASVHIWLINHNNEILFQRRALDKDTFPGLWDVSAAGHIGADENPKIAALREVNEEIGVQLSPKDLISIGKWHERHAHPNNIIDDEIHIIYIVKIAMDLEDVQLQDEEVMAARLMPLETFKSKLISNEIEEFVPHDLDYYHFIIDALTKTF
ncbi:NUDIX hydrolase [Spongiivirga citrea]|uniref:NUDIX domain-containing protein n=1 Tax=Spongiivirga citrea TaxID=1481457 RepID=A0A6M0CHU1_9FLAO|nr:NUDIX domain-containing protein [Spongiivirga citrea]NER17435.1 NUDIX domain-containing protein [Spongiivirga citrea]